MHQNSTANVFVTCLRVPTCSLPALPSTGGANVPLPATPAMGKAPDAVAPLVLPTGPSGFRGTWGGGANAAWRGTFTATGPVPSSGRSGETNYDFKPLAAGFLPAGSWFSFGDLDGGSGAESMRLVAYDASGAPLPQPWLSGAQFARGAGRAPGGGPAVLDMPDFAFDAAAGAYLFTGSSVKGFNPTVSFEVATLGPIYTMKLQKGAANNGFGISAPVRFFFRRASLVVVLL